ncbi:MAG: ABC transporter ATP-binding protein [Pseudomonadota bacterium]
MSTAFDPEIRCGNLTRTFVEGSRQHKVLAAVDLSIRRGECVAIRGRSGSGKSTLLNLIAGIDRPDAGYVEVGGTRLTELDERQRTLFRRRHIGFVYQAFNLIPTLNVADNVRLVLELNGTARRRSNERIASLLDAVGLGDRSQSFPDVLSGGEQQRVAIARALAHEPTVVLADEPTGNLDDAAAERVVELLDRLVRQQGGTLLIATHSARVATFCDRTLALQGGHLEAGSRRPHTAAGP